MDIILNNKWSGLNRVGGGKSLPLRKNLMQSIHYQSLTMLFFGLAHTKSCFLPKFDEIRTW